MWNWLRRVFAKFAPPQRKRLNFFWSQPARPRRDLPSRFEGLMALRGQTAPAEAELTAKEQARVEALADRVLAHFRKNQPALVESMRVKGARNDQVFLAGTLHDLGRSLALRSVASLVVFSNCFELQGTLIDRVVERVHEEIGAELHAHLEPSSPGGSCLPSFIGR